jgi:type I restriction enzyme S subunit
MEGRELPVGWVSAKASTICTKIVDGSHNPPKANATGLPMLSARNIENRHISLVADYRLISFSEFETEDRRTSVSMGDVLLTIVGSIGRTAVVTEEILPFTLQRSVAVLKPAGGISSDYLAYALESPESQKYMQENAKGTAQKGIYLKTLGSIELPIAPVLEQLRIAAKLDTTLAAVEACRKRLDGVAAILKRFRQSVLAAATSGELTREWREERGLADSWKTKVLSEIADSRLGKMLDQGKNTGQLTPYLRNLNVRWFSFDLEDIQEIRLADTEIIDLDVRFGDLLVCEGGEPGRCAVWRGEDSKYTFQKALHRVRTSKHLLADYLSFCLSNSANNGKLEQLFTGTTIKHLTGASLKKFQILLPSREEQEEIVDRVESLFTIADQLEDWLTAARKVVDRLTPALLAKAFRGELVPQDPSDEPASMVLDQIRSSRQEGTASGKPTRPMRRRNAHTSITKPTALTNMLTRNDVRANHLGAILKECGPLSAEALWSASQLEIDDFYAQLRDEEAQGLLRENCGDSPNSPRLLEPAA